MKLIKKYCKSVLNYHLYIFYEEPNVYLATMDYEERGAILRTPMQRYVGDDVNQVIQKIREEFRFNNQFVKEEPIT